MKIKVKANQKYKILTDDEMMMHLHVKRKGASTTKNGRAYTRKSKHKKNNR